MNNNLVLNTGLRLPAPEIEALLQGRIIAIIGNKFIAPGRDFVLCPTDTSMNLLPLELYYNSNFIATAKKALTHVDGQDILLKPKQTTLFAQTEQLELPLISHENVLIKSWARCELCETLNNADSLTCLSKLTIWTKEALQAILTKQKNIFLVYLRVYQLANSLEININPNNQFVALPQSVHASDANPVLSDYTFTQRQKQLQNLQPLPHPELEELQNLLIPISEQNQAAEELNQEINIFLGWSSRKTINKIDPDLIWIQKIAEVGNSSDGHSFEKLVRQAFLKLGFTGAGLNPDSTGGAGGIDFYAEAPYPIVGECKATKSTKVPDGTPAQLLKLGIKNLGKTQYERAIKLIVAAGELTSHALRTAKENEMNLITPETLEKLVSLQAHHQNSINLLEFKECLQQPPFGISDEKILNYIQKIEQNISLRRHIINILKNYLENTKYEQAGIEALHAVYATSNPPQPLDSQEMHEILIELSSPLTGYIGRIRGKDWRRDRFYFLRDLPIS